MPLLKKRPPPPPRQPGLLDHVLKAAITVTASHGAVKLGNEVAARHGENSLFAKTLRAGKIVLDAHAERKQGAFEENAAAAGSIQKQVLASVFSTGLEALREKQREAEMPNGDQCFRLGGQAAARGDATAATGHYETGAAQGHTGCMGSLGVCYETGNGVPIDHERAVHWYTMAAERGHTPAQSDLAIHLGQRGDYGAAAIWGRRAANRGEENAQYLVGFLYENGLGGLPRDLAQAWHWYRLAAEKGVQEAIEALSSLDVSSGAKAPPEAARTGPTRHPRESPAWAAQELGVGLSASKAEINAAFMELMKKAHSDKGGVDSWAANLNVARKILLDRLK